MGILKASKNHSIKYEDVVFLEFPNMTTSLLQTKKSAHANLLAWNVAV